MKKDDVLSLRLHAKSGTDLMLQMLLNKSGSWTSSKEESLECKGGSIRQIFLENLKNGKHRELIDFDEHFDDISRW